MWEQIAGLPDWALFTLTGLAVLMLVGLMGLLFGRYYRKLTDYFDRR